MEHNLLRNFVCRGGSLNLFIFKPKKEELCLPKIPANAHKGTNGHIGIIAASFGLEGAAHLAAISALRAGAGKVSLLVPSECAPFFANRPSESMLCAKGFDYIEEFIKDKDVVLFGCGVGRDKKMKTYLAKLLSVCHVPLIIDADGLFYLKKEMLKTANCPVLLTPHIGEACRLFNVASDELLKKPVFYTYNFLSKTDTTILLKSDFNLCCSSEYAAKMHFGSCALATAGSGDVLAGICASLAHKFNGNMFSSAVHASFIHGTAGKIAEKNCGTYSTTAEEISKNIYLAIKQIL